MEQSDREEVARIVAQAFNLRADRVLTNFETVQESEIWVAASPRGIAAMIRCVPIGQFFGGVSVPMALTRTVAVSADARSQGLLRPLIATALETRRTQGYAISVLTPSSVRAYQRAGYECAGIWAEHEAPVTSAPPGGLPLEPLEESNLDAIRLCYQRFAAMHNGILDRDENWWKATVLSRVRAGKPFMYGLVTRGQVRSYLIYTQDADKEKDFHYHLHLRDLVWTDLESLRSLLGFVAGNRALAVTFRWSGPPQDPILPMLGCDDVRPASATTWMARSVDPGLALERRAYPAGTEAEIELSIDDQLLPAASCSLKLTVSNGRGAVQRIERAAVKLDPGTFAAIYTGWLAPGVAYRLGRLPGITEKSLTAMAQIFAGPIPWSLELL
jgi:predicted acetyltransferase